MAHAVGERCIHGRGIQELPDEAHTPGRGLLLDEAGFEEELSELLQRSVRVVHGL
jgi:hypothetical protein